jgi:hypothetical protein
MRRIVVMNAVTLDGVMHGPGAAGRRAGEGLAEEPRPSVRLTRLRRFAQLAGRTATFSQRAPVARRIANVRSKADDVRACSAPAAS